MGSHIVNGQFQSDRYPWCMPGFVPLKVTDPMAQGLLHEYAQRRRTIDAEFSDDLDRALGDAGYDDSRTELDAAKALAEAYKNLAEARLPASEATGYASVNAQARAERQEADALARIEALTCEPGGSPPPPPPVVEEHGS